MMRIYDRVGGAVVPLVVVVHALRSACSHVPWKLSDLRGTGDLEPLFEGGILALEASLPREVDWGWLERLALLLDDMEKIEFEALASIGDAPCTVACIDSSYWEITGPGALYDLVRKRFDSVEIRDDW